MNGYGSLVLVFAGGLAVGWGFFYGLHRTVEALPGARRPGLLIGASLLVRLALLFAAGALLLHAGGEWQQLLAAVTGVLITRFILLWRFYGARGNPRIPPDKEEPT